MARYTMDGQADKQTTCWKYKNINNLKNLQRIKEANLISTGTPVSSKSYDHHMPTTQLSATQFTELSAKSK